MLYSVKRKKFSMKYLALCVLLLPLVYGYSVPQTANSDVDLIPDISKAEDAKEMPVVMVQLPAITYSVTHVYHLGNTVLVIPDMSKAAEALDADDANADLIPDGSKASDGLDKLFSHLKGLIPDMSVASDANDVLVNDDADQIPDNSLAVYAENNDNADEDLVPDNAVAEYAQENSVKSFAQRLQRKLH